jgi:hypothetical protein
MDQLAATKILDHIVDTLDIPESHYQKAAERHRSLGEWLCRPESRVAKFSPHVTPQGSFRYGTVVRPIHADAEYDLDNVVTLQMPKTAMTQKDLKVLFGEELKAYARTHGMLTPAEEMPRCWRLHYADEVSFHLDSLPCVGEEQTVIQVLVAHRVPIELARRAVAITDKRHPEYTVITNKWLSSNPRGFARWFEEHTRVYAEPRLRALVEMKRYSSVEEVPPYQWRTPIQRSIQLLKRHRDVMFSEEPELAPISMIITNLATRAYSGEPDIYQAVTGIVAMMHEFVRPEYPRIPNPVDPAEDYADKWRKDSRLEDNFWMWLSQVKSDLARLHTLSRDEVEREVRNRLSVNLNREQLSVIDVPPALNVSVMATAPSVSIPSAPKPWGRL